LRFAFLLLLALALPATAQQPAGTAKSLKPWTGGRTPALALPDVDGKVHRLADYRGKAVLVNFWATWCGPCREEMPSMEALRVAMQGKPFVVLAVNVGEGGRVAQSFGERMSLGFPLLLDRDTSTTRAWSARILPASFVIGPDGRIRYSYLGAIDWAGADVRAALAKIMP
jgi:peroxiredoxin